MGATFFESMHQRRVGSVQHAWDTAKQGCPNSRVLGCACAPAVFPKGVLARARSRLVLGLVALVIARAARARGRPMLDQAE